jgi:hypothetical protein
MSDFFCIAEASADSETDKTKSVRISINNLVSEHSEIRTCSHVSQNGFFGSLEDLNGPEQPASIITVPFL